MHWKMLFDGTQKHSSDIYCKNYTGLQLDIEIAKYKSAIEYLISNIFKYLTQQIFRFIIKLQNNNCAATLHNALNKHKWYSSVIGNLKKCIGFPYFPSHNMLHISLCSCLCMFLGKHPTDMAPLEHTLSTII